MIKNLVVLFFLAAGLFRKTVTAFYDRPPAYYKHMGTTYNDLIPIQNPGFIVQTFSYRPTWNECLAECIFQNKDHIIFIGISHSVHAEGPVYNCGCGPFIDPNILSQDDDPTSEMGLGILRIWENPRYVASHTPLQGWNYIMCGHNHDPEKMFDDSEAISRTGRGITLLICSHICKEHGRSIFAIGRTVSFSKPDWLSEPLTCHCGSNISASTRITMENSCFMPNSQFGPEISGGIENRFSIYSSA